VTRDWTGRDLLTSFRKVVKGDETAFADVLPCLGDSAKESLVVFEAVVEPVVLIAEADDQGRRGGRGG